MGLTYGVLVLDCAVEEDPSGTVDAGTDGWYYPHIEYVEDYGAVEDGIGGGILTRSNLYAWSPTTTHLRGKALEWVRKDVCTLCRQLVGDAAAVMVLVGGPLDKCGEENGSS